MSESARHAPRRNLPDWLEGLPCRIGQILIEQSAEGRIFLCHRDDAGRDDLVRYERAEDAMEIARRDDAGSYRPLKTAPNLRHGWILSLPHLNEARTALDLFYPGRAAAYSAWKSGTQKTTPFRETLGRQTGMYRVAAKITDEQANELIANFCRSDGGCLRTILWKRDAAGTRATALLQDQKFDPAWDQMGRNDLTIPLLCQEACNLLVAAARGIVKAAE